MSCNEWINTEIGKIPSRWDFAPMKEYVEINMGQSPKSEFYNTKGKGLPFLQGNRTFGLKYPYYDTYSSDIKKVAEEGDILFSVRAPVGDVNIATQRLCIGRGVASLRMKSGSQEFLYYLLRANRKFIENRENGTVFGSINKKGLEELNLPFPSIEEQEKIANILSSLDDKIELNNEMNKTLEEMAQSLFKRWFVDFEFPNENGEPYKSSGGEMVESELGMIPKGWEVNNIGNCVTFSQGIQIPVKKQTEFFKEGFKRFLRIVDYTSNDNEEPRYVEDKGDRYYCNKREVAMVRYGNSSGFICRRLEGILANNLFKINPCYPLGYNYIYYLLSMEGIQEYITSSAIGSAMPALNHSIIANIKFVVPNENTIKNFENICNQIEERICSNRENSKTISSLRDTLLPKLMSGEIRLK